MDRSDVLIVCIYLLAIRCTSYGDEEYMTAYPSISVRSLRHFPRLLFIFADRCGLTCCLVQIRFTVPAIKTTIYCVAGYIRGVTGRTRCAVVSSQSHCSVERQCSIATHFRLDVSTETTHAHTSASLGLTESYVLCCCIVIGLSVIRVDYSFGRRLCWFGV